MIKKKNELILIGIILLAALVLRIMAVKPGYSVYHPDEPVIYSVAMEMIANHSLNPQRFDYPALPIYINAFFFRTFFIPLALTQNIILNTGAFLDNLGNFDRFMQTIVIGTDHRKNVVFWGRTISALAGVLSILITYLLAKKTFGTEVGIITAFLLTFNYRHLVSSILSLPDIFNTLMTVSAFYAFFLLLEKPTRKRYIFSGILAGLVVATKYQVMIFLPLGLTHLLVALKEKKPLAIIKKLFGLEIFLCIGISVITFFATNPFIVINFREAIRWITWCGTRYEMGIIKLRLTPLWYVYKLIFGKLVTGTVILGIFYSFFKKKDWLKTFILLSFIAVFLFVLLIYSHGGIYSRNYTVLAPFFLIFSALAINKIFSKSFLLAGLATFLISFSPIKNSLITSYYLSRTDNYDCTEAWIWQNLPIGVMVGTVPPSPMEAIDYKRGQYVEFESIRDFTLPELQEAKIDYLTVNLDTLTSEFVNWVAYEPGFWGIPIDVFDNSLAGLVLRQMSRYSVKYCSKPYPVPAHNYFIVQVPKKEKPQKLSLLKTYSFDQENGLLPDGWQVVWVRKANNAGFTWEKGKVCKKGGCLMMAAGASDRFKPTRFVSEAIPVKPGQKYLVEGWVKSEQTLEPEQRDGFIRIDFYSGLELANGQKGIISAVSGRVWGENNWQLKWVEEAIPPGAQFLRISLQHQSSETGFLFDEIKVYETAASSEEQKSAAQKEANPLILYPETIF